MLQIFQSNKEDLLKKCTDHCDILRYEFILSKPCQVMDQLLTETLDRLKDRNVLTQPEVVRYSSQYFGLC